MKFNIAQKLRESICARVSFSIKLQAGGLYFNQIETPEQMFYREFCEIFKRTNFINVYERLLPKSKIFAGVYFRKASGFYYKQNRPLFYYERTGWYIFMKIAFENTLGNKNMFKVGDKKDSRTASVNIIRVSL